MPLQALKTLKYFIDRSNKRHNNPAFTPDRCFYRYAPVADRPTIRTVRNGRLARLIFSPPRVFSLSTLKMELSGKFDLAVRTAII
jgi:hypothetical protein